MKGGHIMTIGEKLRKARGDTPREVVAKAIGVSLSALSMYEIDQRIPRDQIKIKFADYYKTTVQDLFFDPNCHC